jgi:hypothetical protein
MVKRTNRVHRVRRYAFKDVNGNKIECENVNFGDLSMKMPRDIADKFYNQCLIRGLIAKEVAKDILLAKLKEWDLEDKVKTDTTIAQLNRSSGTPLDKITKIVQEYMESKNV